MIDHEKDICNIFDLYVSDVCVCAAEGTGACMNLQKLADDTGWRIITPDGFYDSWYMDNADTAGMQWRTSFWKELWPVLDEKYGLKPDKTYITGLSMGGHGAVNVFLDHPERFAGAGSMSGVLDLSHSYSQKLICSILNKEDILDCAPFATVSRLGDVDSSLLQGKKLVVTCGYDDEPLYVNSANAFAGRCRELGIRHILILSPGVHNWDYWSRAVRQHIHNFSEGY